MPKKANSKKSKKATKPSSSDVSTNREITPEMLIDQGNLAMGKMNIDLAEQFFTRALNMSPTKTSIMDALADAHLQRGAFDKALALLETSCSTAPQENPFKWLFLGQLQSGLEAVQSYRTAIDLVGKQCANEPSDEGNEVAKKQIAKAYCSIAELYLTDLCFEENAEQICEEAVTSCLNMDPASLDGTQTLANLRISQSRKKDAASLISGVYEKIQKIRGRVGQRTVLDDFTQMDELPEELEENPELEFCITTAKIMIECATEDATLRDSAVDLITDMMNEDDEIIELWHLMGVAELSREQPDQELVRYHFERALKMMESLKQETMMGQEVQFAFDCQYEEVIQYLQSNSTAIVNTAGSGKMEEVSSNRIADEEWSDED